MIPLIDHLWQSTLCVGVAWLLTVWTDQQKNSAFSHSHKFAVTDLVGRFQFSNIAPGDYDAFAWDDVEKGAWQDPAFLRDYDGRGKEIHIEEGGKVIVDVVALSLNWGGIPTLPSRESLPA